MGELSIRQIVERCQQGDEQAMGLLYSTCRNRLKAVCRRFVADDQTAEDLLHDAFVMIFSKLNTLKDTSKAEAWMTTVARNTALAYEQQYRQTPVVSLDGMKQDLDAAASMPMPISYDELMNLVSALPKSYQKVFRLSVFEGMTHQQIAALLGIEPHTSSAQLSRAKLLLRRWLQPMVLLLIAALLPLGVWWWTAKDKVSLSGSQSRTVTDSSFESVKSVESIANNSSVADNQFVRPVANNPSVADNQFVGSVANNPSVADNQFVGPVANNPSVADNKSVESVTETPSAADNQSVESVGNNESVAFVESVANKQSMGKVLSVALAYNGIGSTPDSQLPYANVDTNDAVSDSVSVHRMPLIVGLTMNYRLGTHWQVGLGLQYIRMTSDMEWGNTYARMVKEQCVQYFGLPLSVQWHYPLARHFSCYAAANVTLQLPLHSTADSRFVLNGLSVESSTEHLHPGTIWSAGVGLGLQFDLTPNVGFFVEPSLQYYFRNGSGVETWQTEHPAAFSLPFGLRITF